MHHIFMYTPKLKRKVAMASIWIANNMPTLQLAIGPKLWEGAHLEWSFSSLIHALKWKLQYITSTKDIVSRT